MTLFSSNRQSSRPLGSLKQAALTATFALIATTPVFAVCTPVLAPVEDIQVSLIDEPFAYASYVPALTPQQIAQLPDLPDYDDDTVRKEHAYISTTLATDLGLAAVQAEWNAPNPQIRVRIATPSTISNFWKKQSGALKYRDRESSAVFTVVGVINDADRRLWVYEQEAATDTSAGEYKLFAADTGVLATGARVAAAASYPDANLDGRLDGVEAHAFRIAPSASTITPAGGSATTTEHFCELDTDGGYLTESSVEVADNRVLVMAPHGGIIEAGTGEQAEELVLELDVEHAIDANLWQVAGEWSDNQTSQRWHITATNLSEAGYPALDAVMPTTNFGAAPFRFAVAFHGFAATATSKCPGASTATEFYQLILGGETLPANKCLVALSIREALDDAGQPEGKIAISIRNDDDPTQEVADTCGRTVTRTGLDGTAHDNVVNRLATDGGFQLEQSANLRADVALRTAVAHGVAQALDEILTNTAPADPCALLP
jgi:phage replication-related protein YjqB (UPF0714/DUF867 family)